jgi:hypothetical protein
MSYESYTAIRRFIVRHIQDQDFAENDGLPGRVLIHLCLERFSPDLQDPEGIRTEKKSIEGAIRRMVEDCMLQPVNKNQKVVFRLDPYFNIKDKNNPNASQPSEDPQSTQEALEALEKEVSPDIEDQDMDQHMDEELDQQLAQQLDHSMNQMEDQAEEDLDMGERRQDGCVEKVIDNQPEREQVYQAEEVVHNRGDRQDQPDDVGNPAETHQESQAVQDADIQAMRRQEAEEAARIEATSETLPIGFGKPILISSLIQGMQKLTPKSHVGQLPYHRHILRKREKMRTLLEHQAGSAGRCWRSQRVSPRAASILSVRANIRIRPRGGE